MLKISTMDVEEEVEEMMIRTTAVQPLNHAIDTMTGTMIEHLRPETHIHHVKEADLETGEMPVVLGIETVTRQIMVIVVPTTRVEQGTERNLSTELCIIEFYFYLFALFTLLPLFAVACVAMTKEHSILYHSHLE